MPMTRDWKENEGKGIEIREKQRKREAEEGTEICKSMNDK